MSDVRLDTAFDAVYVTEALGVPLFLFFFAVGVFVVLIVGALVVLIVGGFVAFGVFNLSFFLRLAETTVFSLGELLSNMFINERDINALFLCTSVCHESPAKRRLTARADTKIFFLTPDVPPLILWGLNSSLPLPSELQFDEDNFILIFAKCTISILYSENSTFEKSFLFYSW
jgi:ABC-type multidrug transport system fused ATPase/permease subunit